MLMNTLNAKLRYESILLSLLDCEQQGKLPKILHALRDTKASKMVIMKSGKEFGKE